MPGLSAGFSSTTPAIMPESVEPIISRATPSSAFIALRSIPCVSSVAPSCFMASIAPLGRMWPTAASTTELLMILWPFSIAYRWMAVLATPRANTGIFSMRRRASSVHAMVYSACWSIGGTYFLLEIITWQSTMRNRFSAFEPMSMSSSLCTPIRPSTSIQGFSLESFAIQQRGLYVLPFGLGDLAADVEVRLVDLGQPAVDDLLMQLFLLLETEDLAGLLVEDAGDAVEGGVVEVGIEGRDGLDRLVQGLAERQRGLEAAERKVAAVQRDQDGAAVHRQGVLDDEDVRRAYAPDHALRDAADDAVLHGTHAQGAHDDEVVGVGIDVFDEDFEVPSFQRPPFDRNVRFGGLLVYDV